MEEFKRLWEEVLTTVVLPRGYLNRRVETMDDQILISKAFQYCIIMRTKEGLTEYWEACASCLNNMGLVERPYKIGDFIKVKGILGTVEDINFRCTRIRTIEKVLVEVPNAEVTIDVIENYSKMPDRRYDTEIEVLLNTDLEKVKSIKGQIIDFLNQSSYVIENTTDVFFTEITSNGLKLRIYCYLNTGDYREYMMLKDMINTEIISIIRRNNVGLAYDTKTIEIKNT